MVEYIYVWPGFSLCGTDANVKRMQSHKEMSTRVANEVAYAFIPADGECTAFHDTPKGLTEAFACPGNVGVRVRVRVRVRVHVFVCVCVRVRVCVLPTTTSSMLFNLAHMVALMVALMVAF